MFRDAKNLRQEIKRHCDAHDLDIEIESHWECEFCGSSMADENEYECCGKSVMEYQLRTGQEMADCLEAERAR